MDTVPPRNPRLCLPDCLVIPSTVGLGLSVLSRAPELRADLCAVPQSAGVSVSPEPDAATGSLCCTTSELPENPARSVSAHAHPRDPVFVSPRNFFRFSWLELLGSLLLHVRPESTNEAPGF